MQFMKTRFVNLLLVAVTAKFDVVSMQLRLLVSSSAPPERMFVPIEEHQPGEIELDSSARMFA